MRRAVFWISSTAFVLGFVMLGVTRAYSHNRGELYQAAATDFAVALIDLAVTIGIVDLLLKSHSERQRIQSIAPRAAEFAQTLRELRSIRDRYLSGQPSLGDLERYKRVATTVQHSAFDLYLLVSAADAVLGSSLLKLSETMREHADQVEDAIASVRNASADVSTLIDRVNSCGQSILDRSDQLNNRLLHDFHQESV